MHHLTALVMNGMEAVTLCLNCRRIHASDLPLPSPQCCPPTQPNASSPQLCVRTSSLRVVKCLSREWKEISS